MRTRRVVVTGALAGALLALLAGQDLEVALQRTIQQETVTGDLKAAIQEYGKIAANAGSNRAVAAKALVHMAECYQKIGDAEARKVYERVVREYGDQKDAVALARTRLGGSASSSGGILTRQVWTGPNVDVYGAASPDGRLLTFYDKQSGDLALHDLSTGEERRLTNKGNSPEPDQYGEQSVFSPDGKQVAYSWINKNGRYDLRVISSNSPAVRTPRVLCDNEEIGWIGPYSWSQDGKWIAVQLQRTDRTAQIGLVAPGDGSLRILKSVDWRGSLKMSFSPDSRYLAYDLPVGEGSEQRDVFVLAVDGSSEIRAVTNSAEALVVGWSPDGKNLLFASDRTGKTAVYALPFDGGKTHGDARLLVSDIGQAEVIGILRNGTLYYGVRNGSRGFYTASVDFESGKILEPPSQAAKKFLGTNFQPDWSRDGQYLSYQSYGGQRRGVHLVIRSLKTSQTRELWPKLPYFGFAHWSPDGRSLIAEGADVKGRQGIYRIDAQTGDAEAIVVSAPGQVSLFGVSSSDGKRIFYLRGPDGGRMTLKVLVERDTGTSIERELLGPRCTGPLSITTDDESIVCGTFDAATKEPGLLVITVAGGAPRELLRLKPEDVFNLTFIDWTPDGHSIVFRKGQEVWVIAVSGGSPRKVDLGSGPVLDLHIHPDGRRVAFTTRNKRTQEVWAAENLLSALIDRR